MYFSTFILLIASGLVFCSFLKYGEWLRKNELRDKISQDQELEKMFEEYRSFLEKYPDFEKKKKLITKLLKEKRNG